MRSLEQPLLPFGLRKGRASSSELNFVGLSSKTHRLCLAPAGATPRVEHTHFDSRIDALAETGCGVSFRKVGARLAN
jgi:hypothetical protein